MGKRKPKTLCDKPLTWRDFEKLPDDGETILLRDDSLSLMYDIQESLRLLQPMGTDDKRLIRIETIGQDKDIVWFEVQTSCYRDIHSLCLSAQRTGEAYYFANKEAPAWRKDREPEPCSCVPFLQKLWNYILGVVSVILDNPQAYVDYLEMHFPYQEREGEVMRRKVENLLPDTKIRITNRQSVLALLNRLKNKYEEVIDGYKTMTLRKYIDVWKLAYQAFCGNVFSKEESSEDVFLHSNQGRYLDKYGLDSESEFLRWDKEQKPYHCYDVAYVRLTLYPRKNTAGEWFFYLLFGLSCYADEGFRIAMALEKEGIPFVLADAEGMLLSIKGEDVIHIGPSINDYNLPYPGESGIAEQSIQKAVELISWDPFKIVYGIYHQGTMEHVLFHSCDNEHYPDPEQEQRCIIRYKDDDGQWKYWHWNQCPWGWNVLERHNGEYCIMTMK